MPFDPDAYLASKQAPFDPDHYLASKGLNQTPEISKLESGLRGAAQGATLGFADEATGGLEALYDKARGNAGDKSLAELYSQHRDESRANYYAAQKANPKTYLASEIAGGLAPAFVPGLNIGAGATMAARAGRAAAIGGAMGLGNSTADLTKGDVPGALKDAGIGAAVGAVAQPVLEGVGAGAKRLFGGNDVAEAIANKAAPKNYAGLDPFTKQPLTPQTVVEAPATKNFAGFDPFTKQPLPPRSAGIGNDVADYMASKTPMGPGLMKEVHSPIIDPNTNAPATRFVPTADPVPESLPPTLAPEAPESSGIGTAALKKAAGMAGAAVGGSIGTAIGHPIAGTYIGRDTGQAIAKYGPDLAKKIASSKIFSSETLDKIANSKFADLIGGAAQRGDNALSTASFLLAQTDPEFRQLTSKEK